LECVLPTVDWWCSGLALGWHRRQTVGLVGVGFVMGNVGQLHTAVQENANVMIVLMNDQCYGGIRCSQGAQYCGRRCYVELHQPDFAQYCAKSG
ncbi:thiamine pyrophosphate-dependent enzyme, partial [Burkholderia pseudomallei]|uniref:thiamine pyrophosphate-dependent enzyme n=1 Tax=Burkholderia pseudomallei TaxID=28450 RepID=UPI003F685CE1